MRIHIDLKTIIIHLMKEYKITKIDFKILDNFLSYLHSYLYEGGIIKNYQISYDINYATIETWITYNNDMFYLELFDDCTICVKRTHTINNLAEKYAIPQEISNIISEFVEKKYATY